jgi:hypothetical protein
MNKKKKGKWSSYSMETKAKIRRKSRKLSQAGSSFHLEACANSQGDCNGGKSFRENHWAKRPRLESCSWEGGCRPGMPRFVVGLMKVHNSEEREKYKQFIEKEAQ